MCFHFFSWNRCPTCFLTFNSRCNRVPCWNGKVCLWRLHRHGLRCLNGRYERSDDEIYTHVLCPECQAEEDNHELLAKLDVSPTFGAMSLSTTLKIRRVARMSWPLRRLSRRAPLLEDLDEDWG